MVLNNYEGICIGTSEKVMTLICKLQTEVESCLGVFNRSRFWGIPAKCTSFFIVQLYAS